MVTAKRETTMEDFYSRKMGVLTARVVRIKILIFSSIPIVTLHEYRETYYGEIKDISDCVLDK